MRQAVIGHLEGLMAAQRQEGGEPGLIGRSLGDHLIEPLKRHVIVGTPFAEAIRQREVLIRGEPAVASAVEEAPHVGEIDVTPIKHVRLIAYTVQTVGDRGQCLALGGIFHDGGGGLRQIAIQGCHQSSIRAERVGIQVGKANTLLAESVQVRGDAWFTPEGFDGIGRETF